MEEQAADNHRRGGAEYMKRVFNFGSLNIDHVYRVRSISRPGEAVPAADYHRFAGGKGANQSFAIARAGGSVAHMG